MIVFYHPDHMRELATAHQPDIAADLVDPEFAKAFESGDAFTCVRDGKVVGCAGLAPKWRGVAVAWAVFDLASGPSMVEITRSALAFLPKQNYKRVEAYVRTDFALGHRWARMLGFEREATMRAFDQAGNDCDMYATVA